MSLCLYNTIHRRLEDFHPLHDQHVGLYTCGPTVYSTAHIGNLRTYIFADVLRRTLEFNGYTVKHVMNITDVGHLTGDGDMGEDKLEKVSRETHRDAAAIARGYERTFFADAQKLNILPPNVILRATETIDLQIDLIKQLEAKDMTYRTSDGLYFDTAKFPAYGQLSRQLSSEKKAGARVEVNPEKRHPVDFALWKFSQPEDHRQMEWPSPWGTGFPGWHLECSAMSMKELGPQFDIHTGGVDLIAVHHENEIAQSEVATGQHPFVQYWLHGEFLVLPDQRMGKSEGNSITLQDIVAKGLHPLAFRYLCLQTSYRKPLQFSWEALEAANKSLLNLWFLIDSSGAPAKIGCAEFAQRFTDAINDDLNTAECLGIMHELLRSDYPWSAKLQTLKIFDRVLGLGLSPDAQRNHFKEIGTHVQELINQREEARRQKDWARADVLRREIESHLTPLRLELEDTPTGSRLRKK